MTFTPIKVGVKVTLKIGVLTDATHSHQFWCDRHHLFLTVCVSSIMMKMREEIASMLHIYMIH